MKRMNRREFLSLSAAGAGILVLGASGCGSSTTRSLPPALDLEARREVASSTSGSIDIQGSEQGGTTITTAPEQPLNTDRQKIAAAQQSATLQQVATDFLASLDPTQRDKALYNFNDPERFRWHWTTPRGFPRNGLPLREMQTSQKRQAVSLLEASLSSLGFEKALNIISLQLNLGNDPELYYVTLFGTPGSSEPWGWRWEGHHLSHHFSIIADQVLMTPLFLGSWPTTTEAGLRAMAIEEDAALELVNGLPGDLREIAIFQSRPLTRHVTQNAAQVSALEPVGVAYADLAGGQQQLVTEIIQAYLGTQPDYLAEASMDRLNEAGLDQIRFGWAGSLDRQRPQYYRLQGPTFLLEYDNTRNGGTHIHSVWRDFERDFGYHLL